MSAILETERLILRRPEAADLSFYAACYTGPRARFVGGPVAAAAARDHFFAATGEPGMVALIAHENAASRRVAERIGGALDEAAAPPPWAPGVLTYRIARGDAR